MFIPIIKARLSKILLKSDLLTTRAMIGMSSLIFSLILFTHYTSHLGHISDLFWVSVSLVHSITTFWSLLANKVNRITFVGEALAGFFLWNYINLAVLLAFSSGENFSPAGAPFAPTFVIGIATWWVLSRYPSINKTKKD